MQFAVEDELGSVAQGDQKRGQNMITKASHNSHNDRQSKFG